MREMEAIVCMFHSGSIQVICALDIIMKGNVVIVKGQENHGLRDCIKGGMPSHSQRDRRDVD